MERLTARDEFGTPYYPYCDNVKGCGGYCAQCNFETKTMDKLAQYEDLEDLIGIPMKELAEILRQNIPEDCKHPHKAVVLTDDDVDRWNGYKNAEEQGLLLRLPLKIGDTVYSVTRDFISEYTICGIGKYNEGFFFNWKCEKGIYINVRGFTEYDIGETVFLTQVEAEQKLKELRGEQNDRE